MHMDALIRLVIALALTFTWTWNMNVLAQEGCPDFMEIPQGDRMRILMSYEAESMKLNSFPNQKGVAMMEITRNKNDEEVWNLYIEIDDRYKSLPINKYSMIGHMLMLITDGYAPSYSKDSLIRQERNKCLE